METSPLSTSTFPPPFFPTRCETRRGGGDPAKLLRRHRVWDTCQAGARHQTCAPPPSFYNTIQPIRCAISFNPTHPDNFRNITHSDRHTHTHTNTHTRHPDIQAGPVRAERPADLTCRSLRQMRTHRSGSSGLRPQASQHRCELGMSYWLHRSSLPLLRHQPPLTGEQNPPGHPPPPHPGAGCWERRLRAADDESEAQQVDGGGWWTR